MLKVAKFGGSSMADAGQYRKVRDILQADEARKVVVVSAAGKRSSKDYKITDLLYLCHAHTQYGVDCTSVFEMITSRYLEIRDELGLTEYGGFLFNASMPVLSDRDEFNEKCRFERDEEDAVLGCYLDKDIYIYDITDARLDGVRECTTAHELLHAVWKRMGEDERNSYAELLAEVYEKNKDFLEEELSIYDNNERREELYVRAGTEVKNLPKELENHFAKVFKDQDKVVGYYDKYITVFRNLQAELDSLKSEMEEIKLQIEAKEAEYTQAAEQLNADIAEFNRSRNVLISRQEALDELYDEIDALANEYNARVDKYNEDVVSSNKLNQIMNSASKVEGLGE